MHTFAEGAGVPDPPLADVRLAVSEAVTNAIVHGYPGDATGQIEVEATMGSGGLTVIVRDGGAGYAPRLDSPGAGLGMPLISTLADSIEVRSGNPGTELRMNFLLTQ